MKLFLQIEIRQWQQGGYGSQLLIYASSLSGDIMGTDIDSQSDAVIADLVIRLIGQSEKIFLLVQAADANLSIGTGQKVINYLALSPEKVFRAVLSGDHRTAEAALQAFRPRFVKEHDELQIRNLIQQFSIQ